MPLIQIQAPASEPVTVIEAKNHLRVDSDLTEDDALIAMLIGAARRYAETYCARSFITQKWRLVLDAFPGPCLMGAPMGVPYSLPGHAVLLERGSVLSVDSITYQDMTSAWQAMAVGDFVAELSGALGRITPVFGKIWPTPTLPQIGAVRVDYTAGYGVNASDVPEGIRQWILMRVGTLYENREEVAILGRGKVDPLPFVDSLLDPYRIVTL
jgi:uncharacterized phiE125 gp8 family phage protein